MRSMTVMMVAALMASAMASAPAAAAWKEYPQPQLGFVVQFPADPAVSTGTYRTVLVASATAHIYSVRQDSALYVATVVDLLNRKEEGASLLGEAEFNLTMLGDVSGMSGSRVEPGRDAVFGRFMSVDCRLKEGDQPGQAEAARAWFMNIFGIECAPKNRLTVNMFFHRGRMYLILGMIPPSTDGASFGASALRFANSISFFLADGTRNSLDGAP